MNSFRYFFTRKQLIISGIALVLALAGYVFFTRPARAQVGITAGDGAAAWFFQACTDDETQDLGHTEMRLDPADATGDTLLIRTENGYPGYRFHCTATLANTGNIPITLTAVEVNNPHPTKLMVDAHPGTFQIGKTIAPCPIVPVWLTDPATVAASCQVSIVLDVFILEAAVPNTQYGYAISVSLE